MNTGCVTIRDGGVNSNRLRLQCALQVVNDGAGYAHILRAKPMQTPVLSPLPASVFISGISCPHAYVITNVIVSYRLAISGVIWRLFTLPGGLIPPAQPAARWELGLGDADADGAADRTYYLYLS